MSIPSSAPATAPPGDFPRQRVIDLSHPLSAATPAFPGDPWPEITVFDSTDRASTDGRRHMNCSHLAMSLHCGTHMDAPFHFFGDGHTIDQVALDRTMGAATVIRLPYEQFGPTIEPEHLSPYESQLRATRRVLLNTGWHHRWGQDNYFTEHPLITGPAAQLLVDYGVQLVGVDTPSVDRAPYPAHLVFLGNGLLIVENLTNLDAIHDDMVLFIATPLAIVGRDGSPVRALAIV